MSVDQITSRTDKFDTSTLVADVVVGDPRRAAVFERLGIDYCCGGKVPLGQACDDRGLDVRQVVEMLVATSAAEVTERDWSQATVSELIEHIVERHHGYLRSEMPRVALLSHKVSRAHGASDGRLVEAEREVNLLIDELRTHLMDEEDDVFPRCVQLEAGAVEEDEDLAGLLGALAADHTEIAGRLTRLRGLLDDFGVPAHACTSRRAYLDALERLEADIHSHVHKENNILFGKVMNLLYETGSPSQMAD